MAYKRLGACIFLFILFILPNQLWSQILPKEGALLNYRLVGFSFPVAPQAGKYVIEIAEGNINTEDSFKKKIVRTLNSGSNKIIAEVPAFGAQYTWRSSYMSGANAIKSELHHFSTGMIPEVDTAHMRLRIIKEAKKYKDAYVFLDGNRALYNMKGQPVWYLPDVTKVKFANQPKPEEVLLRDLKLSSQGTITFLLEEQAAYEVDYKGTVLWKAPDDGKVSGDHRSEGYHHQFTRLANGHYMVAGSEYEGWNMHLPSSNDSSYQLTPLDKLKQDSTTRYQRLPFGTIIEYDDKGNVVWAWKSSDYFRHSDIYYHIRHGRPDIAAHENAFYFDEKVGVIYISFRNISRILKIKYPEGTVLNEYGEIYKPGGAEESSGLFCRQHSCNLSEEKELYLFDNNSCAFNQLPRLLVFEEQGKGNLKKTWEYQCTIDGVDTSGKHGQFQFPVGGNITELPDHSFFADMSTQYSKVFIVTRDKKILWSAIPEIWNADNKRWDMVYQYRASIVTDPKAMERLIWNAEEKR